MPKQSELSCRLHEYGIRNTQINALFKYATNFGQDRRQNFGRTHDEQYASDRRNLVNCSLQFRLI